MCGLLRRGCDATTEVALLLDNHAPALYLLQLRTMFGLSAFVFLAFAVFSAPTRAVELRTLSSQANRRCTGGEASPAMRLCSRFQTSQPT
jgi:hypothetical protein